MTGLVVGNVWAKKARSLGLAAAMALAVMAVVSLTVLSASLEASATVVLTHPPRD